MSEDNVIKSLKCNNESFFMKNKSALKTLYTVSIIVNSAN